MIHKPEFHIPTTSEIPFQTRPCQVYAIQNDAYDLANFKCYLLSGIRECDYSARTFTPSLNQRSILNTNNNGIVNNLTGGCGLERCAAVYQKYQASYCDHDASNPLDASQTLI